MFPTKNVNYILLVFTGGITYSEIEAIRYLNKCPEYSKYKFLIITTNIISGRSLFDEIKEDRIPPMIDENAIKKEEEEEKILDEKTIKKLKKKEKEEQKKKDKEEKDKQKAKEKREKEIAKERAAYQKMKEKENKKK